MKRGTVLVVEDEPIVAEDLALKLGRMGYEVIGITPRGEDASKAPANHSPLFRVDESGLLLGLRLLARLVVDYQANPA